MKTMSHRRRPLPKLAGAISLAAAAGTLLCHALAYDHRAFEPAQFVSSLAFIVFAAGAPAAIGVLLARHIRAKGVIGTPVFNTAESHP